jgi:peroxiredoxin
MKQIILAFLFLFILNCESRCQDSLALKVGDPPPDFSLPYATKDSVGHGKLELATIIGKRIIVLAFYPADWSGGCTKEMCTMRDNFSDLANLDADVFGMSGDYVFSHHEWAKNLNLPFTLLADHSHEVAKRYLSYNPETGFNHRTVYVIDKTGKIAYIDREYKTQDQKSFINLQDAITRLHQ